MAKVIYLYDGNKIPILCCNQERMKEICIKFAVKVKKDINVLLFLYNGQEVNQEKTYEQIINSTDKQRNAMNVVVYEINQTYKTNQTLAKSKEIICPKCGENALINISRYKIKIFNCKNNHIIENLSFFDFENTQKIDESKINCGFCIIKNKKIFITMNYIDAFRVE